MMINGYGVVMIVVDMVISNVVASVNGYGVVIGCIIFFCWLLLVCRDSVL